MGNLASANRCCWGLDNGEEERLGWGAVADVEADDAEPKAWTSAVPMLTLIGTGEMESVDDRREGRGVDEGDE